jgi:hypothetical protein
LIYMVEKIETLDYYVIKAVDFIEKQGNLTFDLPESNHTLVVGSQNGLLTGRIIYRFAKRSFSHAKEVLAQCEIDAKRNILKDVTIVSATGSRQVVPIASYALERGLKVNAILCNYNSELKKNFDGEINVIACPAIIEEPPTVNTATYGTMIQAVTHENVSEIRRVVESLKEPQRGYGQFNAFNIITTDSMPEVAEMVDWKLRGEMIGRCTATMATHLTNFMHGGAINDADKELYVALGLTTEEKEVFEQVLEPVPEERKHYVDVPDSFGPLGFMMLGYSVVGQIQKNYPAFQKNIEDYGRRARKWKWLSPLRDTK